MRIAVPVTDYIPASILTTLNDLVIRGAAAPVRYGQLSAVHARITNAQNIPNNTWTLIEWNVELEDTNNEMDLVNYYFVPNRDKYIVLSAGVKIGGLGDGDTIGIRCYHGGNCFAENMQLIGSGGSHGLHISCCFKVKNILFASIQVYQNSGAGQAVDITVGTNWFCILEVPVVP